MILKKVDVNSNKCFDLKEGNKTVWNNVTNRLGVTSHNNLIPIVFEKQMNQMLRYYGVEFIDVN